ncbi:MAG: hypothetical protein HDT28_00525 [Clostridiales bacterium]|nr:hypothetical protein [Clostridiales bacterium]
MKRIQTKLPISLEIASAFIDSVRIYCKELLLDDEFCRLYTALQDYIEKKFRLRTTTDIVDKYVVYEQKQNS